MLNTQTMGASKMIVFAAGNKFKAASVWDGEKFVEVKD